MAMDVYDGRDWDSTEEEEVIPTGCGCSSEKPEIGQYKIDDSTIYIKDFKIKSFDKRLASLERRVTDIEYALMAEYCGPTGLVDREDKLVALDKRIWELEQQMVQWKQKKKENN